jgi:ribosomal protein S12
MPYKWNKRELKVLEKSNGKIPKIKRRSRESIRKKMIELGLIKKIERWTHEEINSLKKGLPLPNRSKLAISKKKHELGLNKNYRWTSEEIELLKKNLTVSTKHPNSVKRKLTELGLRKKRETRQRWTDEEIKKLIELKNQGKSAQVIYQMEIFSKSENSIQKKLARLGLVNKLKIFKFKDITRLKFKKFLLENWQGKTPLDLLEIWNKENHKTPANLSKVINYLNNLKIKISCYEVQKINNLRKKEKQLNLENKGSPEKLIEKIRLERIKLMQERIAENKDMWSGIDLHEKIDLDS